MRAVLGIIYMLLLTIAIALVFSFFANNTQAVPPKPTSKFYDFSAQIIDGHIKKPTALYTDAKQKVKFDRLLKLKKSFLPAILDTAKEPVFR